MVMGNMCIRRRMGNGSVEPRSLAGKRKNEPQFPKLFFNSFFFQIVFKINSVRGKSLENGFCFPLSRKILSICIQIFIDWWGTIRAFGKENRCLMMYWQGLGVGYTAMIEMLDSLDSLDTFLLNIFSFFFKSEK